MSTPHEESSLYYITSSHTNAFKTKISEYVDLIVLFLLGRLVMKIGPKRPRAAAALWYVPYVLRSYGPGAKLKHAVWSLHRVAIAAAPFMHVLARSDDVPGYPSYK